MLTAGVESLLEDKLADAETNGSGPGALPGSPKVTVDGGEGVSTLYAAVADEGRGTDLEHRERRKEGGGGRGWRAVERMAGAL